MRVSVLTPPASPVVSLEEAKEHLRFTADDEDDLIEATIAAATTHLDGPLGWLGRALAAQSIELWLDGFDDPIMLPCPPVISITSVEYRDSAGAMQLVAAASYELRGGRLVTAWGKAWPSPAGCNGRGELVRVVYQAGYTQLPKPIRAALLLMVGDLFVNRQTGGSDHGPPPNMSVTVANLLAPYRVWA